MSDRAVCCTVNAFAPDAGVVGEYQGSGCPGHCAEDQSLLYAPTHNQK